MQFRLDWILEMVDLPEGADDPAERLTDVGLTVDAREPCGDTWLLDLDLAANRGDVLSHRGVARELAASHLVALGEPDCSFESVPGSSAERVPIRIEESAMCSRYIGRVVEDVAPGSSPVWLEDRLSSLGARPVINVVDATNYVLWELGQPLHAFDLDKLAGPEIIVRRARPGEKLVTLDEEERTLHEDDLVIADAERPVAIAGVMGGLETMITEGTTRVLLESAWFDPTSVRATAKRHGMRTDASVRFERGVDPRLAPVAAERFCNVLASVGGGRVLAEASDVRVGEIETHEVRLRWERAEKLMGMTFDRRRLVQVLEGLGFEVVEGGAETGELLLEVPSWRHDVSREVDLIEEIGRHQGYAEVPATLPSWSGGSTSRAEVRMRRRERMRDISSAAGFLENVNYAFIGAEADESWRYREGEGEPLLLENPLAVHQAAMRGSLLPGLLDALRRNQARGRSSLWAFEMGKRFWRGEEGVPREAWTLAWILAGRVGESAAWKGEGRDADFYDLSGAVEGILEAAGTRGWSVEPASQEFLHPAESAAIHLDGEILGPLGRLHPERLEGLELEGRVYVGEIDLEGLLDEEAGGAVEVTTPSRFPWADRDLSLLLPPGMDYERLVEAILSMGQEALQAVWPVDRYRGEELEGVSLTVRLRYQREDRTMGPDEATELAEAVVEYLSENLNVARRS